METPSLVEASEPGDLQTIDGTLFTWAELRWAARQEGVVHLDDLLLRRTMLAYLGQLTKPLVDELADTLGEALGWDEARKKAEVERALAILADRHGVLL